MDHCVDPGQRGRDSGGVARVADHEVSPERHEAFPRGRASVAVDVWPQGVEHQDPVGYCDQLGDKGLSDETGSAGDENAHPATLSRLPVANARSSVAGLLRLPRRHCRQTG